MGGGGGGGGAGGFGFSTTGPMNWSEPISPGMMGLTLATSTFGAGALAKSNRERPPPSMPTPRTRASWSNFSVGSTREGSIGSLGFRVGRNSWTLVVLLWAKLRDAGRAPAWDRRPRTRSGQGMVGLTPDRRGRRGGRERANRN
jgi:hypothetical protein